jgi:hypothetical protein
MCTQEKLNSPFVTRYIACERKKKTPIELQRRDTQRKDRGKMMVTKETPVACYKGHVMQDKRRGISQATKVYKVYLRSWEPALKTMGISRKGHKKQATISTPSL